MHFVQPLPVFSYHHLTLISFLFIEETLFWLEENINCYCIKALFCCYLENIISLFEKEATILVNYSVLKNY